MNTLEIISDFQGAKLDSYEISDNEIFIQYNKESCFIYGQEFDYAWSFTFGIENSTDVKQIVKVYVNTGKEISMLRYPALIFSTRNLKELFQPFMCDSRTEGFKKYYLEFGLEPFELIYISNTVPRIYENFIQDLLKKAESRNITVGKIGDSVENRPIYSFSFINNVHKPNILITTGFHPAEPDTFAAESIIDYLSLNNNGKRYLEHYNIYIIPAVNPDGFVHGLNGSNINGINLYWDFKYRNKEEAPETYYLWQFVKKIKPILYIDFHCYTQQSEKQMSPYLKPLFFYAGKFVRGITKDIDDCLLNLCDGKATTNYLTVIPSTLSYLITKKFNTIAYTKFHFHLKNGLDSIRQAGLDVFKETLNALIKHRVFGPAMILKKPFGAVKDNIILKLRRAFYQCSFLIWVNLKLRIKRIIQMMS